MLIDGRFEVARSGTVQSICLEKSVITTGIWCLRTFQSPLRTEIVGCLAECLLQRMIGCSLPLSVFPAAMPIIGGKRVPAVFGVVGDGRRRGGVSVGVGANALSTDPRFEFEFKFKIEDERVTLTDAFFDSALKLLTARSFNYAILLHTLKIIQIFAQRGSRFSRQFHSGQFPPSLIPSLATQLQLVRFATHSRECQKIADSVLSQIPPSSISEIGLASRSTNLEEILAISCIQQFRNETPAVRHQAISAGIELYPSSRIFQHVFEKEDGIGGLFGQLCGMEDSTNHDSTHEALRLLTMYVESGQFRAGSLKKVYYLRLQKFLRQSETCEECVARTLGFLLALARRSASLVVFESFLATLFHILVVSRVPRVQELALSLLLSLHSLPTFPAIREQALPAIVAILRHAPFPATRNLALRLLLLPPIPPRVSRGILKPALFLLRSDRSFAPRVLALVEEASPADLKTLLASAALAPLLAGELAGTAGEAIGRCLDDRLVEGAGIVETLAGKLAGNERVDGAVSLLAGIVETCPLSRHLVETETVASLLLRCVIASPRGEFVPSAVKLLVRIQQGSRGYVCSS